jgi:DNA polymerase-3 subunit delta'
MTIAAANSLLKTLEEPAPNTTLILVTARLGALLPTLRSRCQLSAVRAPNMEQGMSWLATQSGAIDRKLLEFANGAPLRALALSQGQYATLARELDTDLATLFGGKLDVTHIAKRWSGDDLPDRLAHLDAWLCTKLRQGIIGIDDPITGTPLPSAAPQLNISRLYTCLDKTRALAVQLTRTALQRELALAALLIELMDAYAGRSPSQVA